MKLFISAAVFMLLATACCAAEETAQDISQKAYDAALALRDSGQEAEQENRTVLALQERVLGPENPETLGTCYNLARRLVTLKKYRDALEHAQHAYAGQMKILGEEHPDTRKSKNLVEELLKAQRNGTGKNGVKPGECA